MKVCHLLSQLTWEQVCMVSSHYSGRQVRYPSPAIRGGFLSALAEGVALA